MVNKNLPSNGGRKIFLLIILIRVTFLWIQIFNYGICESYKLFSFLGKNSDMDPTAPASSHGTGLLQCVACGLDKCINILNH